MENPPFYAPFSFIKQLTSSLREVINHAVEFHIQLLPIAMRMCICMPGRQIGGLKNQPNSYVRIFQSCFAYKQFMQH